MSYSPFIQTQKSYDKNCEYCNKLIGSREHHKCNFSDNYICELTGCGISYKNHYLVNHPFYKNMNKNSDKENKQTVSYSIPEICVECGYPENNHNMMHKFKPNLLFQQLYKPKSYNKIIKSFEHQTRDLKDTDICKWCGINYKNHSIFSHRFTRE